MSYVAFKPYKFTSLIEDRSNKFRVACIIRKCTQELIDKLESYGYVTESTLDLSKHKEIITYKFGAYVPSEHVEMTEEEKRKWVDCGTCERLFLLLTGINNSTYKNRVFVKKVTHWNEQGPKWAINLSEEKNSFFRLGWRQARAEEIIANFADGTGDTIDTIECLPGNEYMFEKTKKYIRGCGDEIIYR